MVRERGRVFTACISDCCVLVRVKDDILVSVILQSVVIRGILAGKILAFARKAEIFSWNLTDDGLRNRFNLGDISTS